MNKIVIDASVVASWLFPDEQNDYADEVKEAVEDGLQLVAPALFLSEISNIFLVGEKRNRVSVEQGSLLLYDLTNLPITINLDLRLLDVPKLADLARKHKLTSYDATYLFIAKLLNLNLATLDEDLENAGAKENIELWKKI